MVMRQEPTDHMRLSTPPSFPPSSLHGQSYVAVNPATPLAQNSFVPCMSAGYPEAAPSVIPGMPVEPKLGNEFTSRSMSSGYAYSRAHSSPRKYDTCHLHIRSLHVENHNI